MFIFIKIMDWSLIIILILCLAAIGILLYFLLRKKSGCSSCRRHNHKPKYKGVILFDVDGTLTTGKNNSQTVQNVLDKGYAVGICTAGSLYNPANITSFKWIPQNLFQFMQKNNFNTFNNVASGILAGKNGINTYRKEIEKKPKHIFWPGWLKAVAMKKTGEIYGTNNVILLDNDGSFIEGVKSYDKNLRVICAGRPCGRDMTPEITKKLM